MRKYLSTLGFFGVFVAAGLMVAVIVGTEELAPKFMRPDVYARFVAGYGDDLVIGVSVFLFIAYVLTYTFLVFIGPTLSFFGGGATTRRILRTGRPATAVVKHIGESSQGGVITVNDQPYLNLVLEVNDGARTPYEVSLDTIIPRYAVPQFQPGAMIPVKVDPNDPEQIAIVWDGSVTVA
jgi:hypothetical protein